MLPSHPKFAQDDDIHCTRTNCLQGCFKACCALEITTSGASCTQLLACVKYDFLKRVWSSSETVLNDDGDELGLASETKPLRIHLHIEAIEYLHTKWTILVLYDSSTFAAKVMQYLNCDCQKVSCPVLMDSDSPIKSISALQTGKSCIGYKDRHTAPRVGHAMALVNV